MIDKRAPQAQPAVPFYGLIEFKDFEVYILVIDMDEEDSGREVLEIDGDGCCIGRNGICPDLSAVSIDDGACSVAVGRTEGKGALCVSGIRR